ncbi:MAG: hypothetical protein Q8P44_03315 [Dehalococcoidia bacterium]|nr:hypothetical protein [Dehalococcoidia bacterium]
MSANVNGIFQDVEPIYLREPLAETLGAFPKGSVQEYTFLDVIKAAGHACPTVAGAYVICRKSLQVLYSGETPVRGEIAVIVQGEPDEGVYGVMSQVFSFITGAAPLTGFRGLGPKFKRKDLLKFSPDKIDPQAMSFEFRRLDTGKSVTVNFYPQRVPFPQEKAKRMGELMESVIWEAAKENEIKEFQELWVEKVKAMVIEEQGIEDWLRVKASSES